MTFDSKTYYFDFLEFDNSFTNETLDIIFDSKTYDFHFLELDNLFIDETFNMTFNLKITTNIVNYFTNETFQLETTNITNYFDHVNSS